MAVTSLEERGRVTLPADYVTGHVALAYAVTVHKAQGVTVDQAVLVVDRATSAEHLYVGLTRGRLANHATVVCEPADTEHPSRQVPTAHDVLAAALGRSSAGALRHRNPPPKSGPARGPPGDSRPAD